MKSGETPIGQGSSGKKQILRAAGVVGGMTLLSRVLGMIRDILTARKFGTSWQWDAFVYAFMLPNFLRRLVGEGALSNAFIPVYTETLQRHGKDQAFRFANLVGTMLTAGLVIFLLAAEGILHILLKLNLPPSLHLTIELLRVFFPYLFFISLFALAMGILNCHQHFFSPALGPVILDLAWIAGVLAAIPAAGHMPERQLHWLALVLLFSGVLQFAVDIPPLLKMGFKFQWIWDFADERFRRTLKLIVPAVMSFAVVQINMVLDSTLAYFLGPGANSSLWYGTRLMQFPLGVFGIAMGTALLPTISSQLAGGNIESAKKTISFSLRAVAVILMPCTVGLIALRTPIVQMIFERGEFDALSTARTASVLLCYSIGLFAYSGQKMIAAGFFAAQDMKTPVKLGILSLVLNMVLNLSFMPFLRESGLALATSIASIAEFLILIFLFQKKIASLPMAELTGSFIRILAAALAMGFVCMICQNVITPFFPGTKLTALLAKVFIPITVSTLAYGGFCLLFRVREMKEAILFIQKKQNF